MSFNNVLFYSKKCDYCTKLFRYISEVDSINNYRMICIDNNQKNFPFIQRVPTLIVESVKKPIVGINAFKWIKTKSQFNKQTNNILTNPNKYLNKEDNPILFDIKNKLKKINSNNSYSFLDNNDTDKNMSYIEEENSIYSIPEVTKININDQKIKLNKLLNIRAKQDRLIYNEETSEELSTKSRILEDEKQNQINKSSKNFNKKFNDVQFSVPNKKYNNSFSNDLGLNTSKFLINKKNYNI